jgi:hypothetical protein
MITSMQKTIITVIIIILSGMFFSMKPSYCAAASDDDRIVPPAEAVNRIEEWLSANSDGFMINGDMVRKVIEYDHIYFMILSPEGWLMTPKTEKTFGPHNFGPGKMSDDRLENFKNSFWGQMGNIDNATGVIVYENSAADRPRRRIYRGMTDMPYDNKIVVEYVSSDGTPRIYEGTPGNDVFVVKINVNNPNASEAILIGNGGNDIYDLKQISNGTRLTIQIDKKSPDETNAMIIGSPFGWIKKHEGNDLILSYTEAPPSYYPHIRYQEKQIRFKDWYVGPNHRPDAMYGDGGSWGVDAYMPENAALIK